MSVNLLVRKKSELQTLEVFIQDISLSLQYSNWVERKSSNYPPENRYFLGLISGTEVTVCVGGYAKYPSYDFLLFFEKSTPSESIENINAFEKSCATKLAAQGYDVLCV